MNIDENIIVFIFLNAMQDTNKVMLDVGAHTGSSVTPFLKDNWDVFAFEPDKRNRISLDRLKERYPNLTIDSRAVSDRTQKNISFYTSNISTGISGLSKFHKSHKITDKVDTITLKDVCSDNNIQKIDYLKIDTEGFDLFVLKGVPWKTIKPKIILCEFEDNKTKNLGYQFDDMAKFLINKGYRLIISEWFPVEEYGKEHSWNCFKEYPCKFDTDRVWGNIIAFANDLNYFKFMNSIVYTLEAKNKSVNNKLNSLYKSRSWRITKPLRYLFSFLK
jgi:FkbM family methyltransferase